jgi:hypothetical protein
VNFTTMNHPRWVARATGSCRWVTGPLELRRVRFGFATLLSSMCLSHSGRHVADRHRLVACATSSGGKRKLPVSSSHFGSIQHGGQL